MDTGVLIDVLLVNDHHTAEVTGSIQQRETLAHCVVFELIVLEGWDFPFWYVDASKLWEDTIFWLEIIQAFVLFKIFPPKLYPNITKVFQLSYPWASLNRFLQSSMDIHKPYNVTI